jgi:hypothetical protein
MAKQLNIPADVNHLGIIHWLVREHGAYRIPTPTSAASTTGYEIGCVRDIEPRETVFIIESADELAEYTSREETGRAPEWFMIPAAAVEELSK